jgi:LacI family repressor for deo operon, udp, cdd, tsx, nupC, and nupG
MTDGSRRASNMQDVARLAKVSVSTVSRALSGAPGVSAATRHRIGAIAEELSYVVSPEASGLATRTTRRVAVVVPETESWFYYAVLCSAEPVLRAAGLDLLFYRVTGSADRNAFFAELPARRKVDAAILIAVPVSDEQRERLDTMNVPIVMAGSRVRGYPYVAVDEARAARQAVNHLIRVGHRRIGIIRIVGPEGESRQPDAGRDAGYRQALAAAKIPFEPQLEVQVDFSLDGGARAMDQLLSLEHPPTAVFAFSDEIAIGAMRSLRRMGLRIPADISVVGIDDHPMAELSDLTTVRQPVHQFGETAARMVVDVLKGRAEPTNVVLPTHLVVRGSTAPLHH